MFKKVFLVAFILSLLAGNCFAQTASPAQQVLDIKQGFNFIAFTVKPPDTAAAFKLKNPAIEDIYAFSTASGAFVSVSEGTLVNLSAGKGYIVKAASAFTTTVTGEAAGTIGSINLKSGFNLVGISKAVSTLKFGDILKGGMLLKGIYKWSAAAGSFISVIKNAGGLTELIDGIDPLVSAGQSFFINASSDTTLSYDNGTLSIGGTTITAEDIRGYANKIFITDNEDLFEALRAIFSLEEFNPLRGFISSVLAELPASSPAAPSRAIAGSKTGNYGGVPYNVNYSVVLYNSKGAVINYIIPPLIAKYTATINGTVGSVECNITTTCDNIKIISFTSGSTLTYSCHQVQNGTLKYNQKTFSYALDMNATYDINFANSTFAVSNATGTMTINLVSGWTIELAYNGTTASGAIKKDGIPEGSVSVSADGTCTITDYESQKSITISKTGITKNY